MNHLLQSLENRVLMSATVATLTADASAVAAASANTKASFASLKAVEGDLYYTVASDVKSTSTKSQKSANLKLNSALIHADLTAEAKILAAETVLSAVAKAGGIVSVALGKAATLHPTSAAVQKAITRETTVLNAAVAAKELALSNAVTKYLGAINTVYSEVAIEDPSAAADITTGEADVAATSASYTATAGTIQTAVTQLTTDLATL
jgi:hypothetical protein